MALCVSSLLEVAWWIARQTGAGSNIDVKRLTWRITDRLKDALRHGVGDVTHADDTTRSYTEKKVPISPGTWHYTIGLIFRLTGPMRG